MINILLVILGGALGSLARYGLSVRIGALWPITKWPVSTFIANSVGILGGFPTFPGVCLETIFMLERRYYMQALSYAVSVVLAAGSVAFGIFSIRKVVI